MPVVVDAALGGKFGPARDRDRNLFEHLPRPAALQRDRAPGGLEVRER